MMFSEVLYAKFLIIIMFLGVAHATYMCKRDGDEPSLYIILCLFLGTLYPALAIIATGLLYGLIFLFTG